MLTKNLKLKQRILKNEEFSIDWMTLHVPPKVLQYLDDRNLLTSLERDNFIKDLEVAINFTFTYCNDEYFLNNFKKMLEIRGYNIQRKPEESFNDNDQD